VDELLLDRREEALRDCVVMGVAARAHRDGDAGVRGRLAEAEADVLAALIGVVREPWLGATSRASHPGQSTTSLARMCSAIDQPTIGRE
jgi:hypothetical protein